MRKPLTPEQKERKRIKDKERYNKKKEIIAQKAKLYREKNKDEIKKTYEIWLKNNEQKKKDSDKKYYECNKSKIKEYRKINKNKIQEYYNSRYKSDINFKLSKNVRNMINQSFKRNGYTKKSKNYDILGCTYDELKLHLEKQFELWMNWDNRGLYNGQSNYGWDIDHIIPLDTAKTEEDIIRLNHYTNLQPLCSHINRDIKRNAIL